MTQSRDWIYMMEYTWGNLQMRQSANEGTRRSNNPSRRKSANQATHKGNARAKFIKIVEKCDAPRWCTKPTQRQCSNAHANLATTASIHTKRKADSNTRRVDANVAVVTNETAIAYANVAVSNAKTGLNITAIANANKSVCSAKRADATIWANRKC